MGKFGGNQPGINDVTCRKEEERKKHQPQNIAYVLAGACVSVVFILSVYLTNEDVYIHI